jgi:hypothetical protein
MLSRVETVGKVDPEGAGTVLQDLAADAAWCFVALTTRPAVIVSLVLAQ